MRILLYLRDNGVPCEEARVWEDYASEQGWSLEGQNTQTQDETNVQFENMIGRGVGHGCGDGNEDLEGRGHGFWNANEGHGYGDGAGHESGSGSAVDESWNHISIDAGRMIL